MHQQWTQPSLDFDRIKDTRSAHQTWFPLKLQILQDSSRDSCWISKAGRRSIQDQGAGGTNWTWIFLGMDFEHLGWLTLDIRSGLSHCGFRWFWINICWIRYSSWSVTLRTTLNSLLCFCGGSVYAHSCYRWILDASQFAKSGIDWLMDGLASGKNPFEKAGSFEDLLYLETLTELNPCVSTA